MHALIDADVVLWRSACSAENDEQWVACARADQIMQDIIADVGAESHKAFISGPRETNFRTTVSPAYKANRIGLPQPKHKAAVREFLVTHWGAEITDGYEADDALGMHQTQNTVLCGVDKDLLQIPGNHYNFVKKEASLVTPFQGMKKLYLQAIIGDTSDNIFGIKGMGPVKAEKALAELLTAKEMYEKCRELYNDDERLLLNLKLLYIWQKPNDAYEVPT